MAVSVAAPAFATSISGPVVSAGASCKCPGSGGNNFNFKTVLSVTTSGNNSWTFTFTGYTFDGATVTPLPGNQTLPGGDGNLILIYNLTNSAAKHIVSVSYTAKNNTTNEEVSDTFGPVELTFSPSCTAPVVCP